jgi:predicted alpha/beta hydrolase family esterase
MKASNVLILPGWQGSGPEHWQSRWERLHGYRHVEQHDWMRPLRGDWIARLEDVVLTCDEPAVLVAHSLGCIQVAAWAAHSANTRLVKGALLVAPGDVDRAAIDPMLWSWPPIPQLRLPFRGVLIASRNDPWCSFERSQAFAAAWGAQLIDHGMAGHINADAGLGSWPEGHVLLDDLMRD